MQLYWNPLDGSSSHGLLGTAESLLFIVKPLSPEILNLLHLFFSSPKAAPCGTSDVLRLLDESSTACRSSNFVSRW